MAKLSKEENLIERKSKLGKSFVKVVNNRKAAWKKFNLKHKKEVINGKPISNVK